MIRVLSWVITVPVTLFVLLFAVSNRGPVTFSLFPFDVEVTAPGFLMPLVMFVLGFLVGGVMQAPGVVKARLHARKWRKQAESEHETALGLRRKVVEGERAAARPADSLPGPEAGVANPALTGPRNAV